MRWILIMTLALTGCANRKVVGTTVYHRISFGSLFGPNQSIVVAYPLGQTNLQQIVTGDSTPGPGGAILGSAITSAGIVWGAASIRPDRTTVSNSSRHDGGDNTFNAGSPSTIINNTPTISGGNQDVQVNAPGSRP